MDLANGPGKYERPERKSLPSMTHPCAFYYQSIVSPAGIPKAVDHVLTANHVVLVFTNLLPWVVILTTAYHNSTRTHDAVAAERHIGTKYIGAAVGPGASHLRDIWVVRVSKGGVKDVEVEEAGIKQDGTDETGIRWRLLDKYQGIKLRYVRVALI